MDNNLIDYQLFLSESVEYDFIDNEFIPEEDKYFKHKIFNLSNYGIKSETCFQFNNEEILKTKEVEFLNDLLEYNEISSFIYEMLNHYDLTNNIDKLKEFNNNLKELILYENYKDEYDYKKISVITYKDQEVAYDFDSRTKRDNTDYIYFKNIESFKLLLIDFLNTYDNIDEQILDRILNKINYNIINDLSSENYVFQKNSYFISKEEYEQNNVQENTNDMNI